MLPVVTIKLQLRKGLEIVLKADTLMMIKNDNGSFSDFFTQVEKDESRNSLMLM
jgi:hypothetical protein